MSERESEFEEEQTVIVASEDPVDDEHTVIVASEESVDDEHTVIVAPEEPDDDEHTVIVAEQEPDEDERTVIVTPAADLDDDATSIVSPANAAPAVDSDSPELSVLDEQSIRRVVRSRRLPREPLRPMPVPPGRHGPMLPGAGAGAVFVADVRTAPAAAPEPQRPAPISTVRVGVPSVAAASRRSAVIALVTASASVLVSVVGLVWVVRTVLGA